MKNHLSYPVLCALWTCFAILFKCFSCTPQGEAFPATTALPSQNKADSWGGWTSFDGRTGIGTAILSDGLKVEGKFVRGKPHGYAVAMYPNNGGVYKGHWYAGVRHGLGTFSANGSSFTGKWSNNQRSGMGIMFLQDGNTYLGEWRDNLRHGVGVEITQDGNIVYRGQYSQGRREGMGIAEIQPGVTYTGYWMEDMRHGLGMITTPLLSTSNHHRSSASTLPTDIPTPLSAASVDEDNPHESNSPSIDTNPAWMIEWADESGSMVGSNGATGTGSGSGTTRKSAEWIVYMGNWFKDMRHGLGKGRHHPVVSPLELWYAVGDSYSGVWTGDRRGAYGEYTSGDHKTFVEYHGEFDIETGLMSGFGMMTLNTWKTYGGEVANGTRNGRGIIKPDRKIQVHDPKVAEERSKSKLQPFCAEWRENRVLRRSQMLSPCDFAWDRATESAAQGLQLSMQVEENVDLMEVRHRRRDIIIQLQGAIHGLLDTARMYMRSIMDEVFHQEMENVVWELHDILNMGESGPTCARRNSPPAAARAGLPSYVEHVLEVGSWRSDEDSDSVGSGGMCAQYEEPEEVPEVATAAVPEGSNEKLSAERKAQEEAKTGMISRTAALDPQSKNPSKMCTFYLWRYGIEGPTNTSNAIKCLEDQRWQNLVANFDSCVLPRLKEKIHKWVHARFEAQKGPHLPTSVPFLVFNGLLLPLLIVLARMSAPVCRRFPSGKMLRSLLFLCLHLAAMTVALSVEIRGITYSQPKLRADSSTPPTKRSAILFGLFCYYFQESIYEIPMISVCGTAATAFLSWFWMDEVTQDPLWKLVLQLELTCLTVLAYDSTVPWSWMFVNTWLGPTARVVLQYVCKLFPDHPRRRGIPSRRHRRRGETFESFVEKLECCLWSLIQGPIFWNLVCFVISIGKSVRSGMAVIATESLFVLRQIPSIVFRLVTSLPGVVARWIWGGVLRLLTRRNNSATPQRTNRRRRTTASSSPTGPTTRSPIVPSTSPAASSGTRPSSSSASADRSASSSADRPSTSGNKGKSPSNAGAKAASLDHETKGSKDKSGAGGSNTKVVVGGGVTRTNGSKTVPSSSSVNADRSASSSADRPSTSANKGKSAPSNAGSKAVSLDHDTKGSKDKSSVVGGSTKVVDSGSVSKTNSSVEETTTASVSINLQRVEDSQPMPSPSAKPSKECVICLDEPKNCIFQPCFHLCACMECGERLRRELGRCPMCRTPIKKVNKVYEA